MTHHPIVWLEGVAQATLLYLGVPTDTAFIHVRAGPLTGLRRVYDTLLYGRIPGAWRPAGHPSGTGVVAVLGGIGWFVPLALVITMVEALRRSRRLMNRRGGRGDVLFVYVALLVLWVSVVVNTLEFGENERFRVEIEPLLYGATVAAVGGWASERTRSLSS
jgi:hypothetical protein